MKTFSKLALAAAVLLTAGTTMMAEDVWYLETDTQQSIPMEDVSFLLAADDDEHFSVVTNGSGTIDGVTRATFALRTVSGVEQHLAADGGELSVFPTAASSTLDVSGCRAGSKILVTSLTGQVVMTAKAADGNATIDVSRLSAGCYILTVGNSSVKFIKR